MMKKLMLTFVLLTLFIPLAGCDFFRTLENQLNPGDAEIEEGAMKTRSTEKYPDAYDLDQLLASQKLSDARDMIQTVVKHFEDATRTELPDNAVNDILENPNKIWRLLALTPKQLSNSAKLLNAFPWTGKDQEADSESESNHVLPSIFYMSDLDSMKVDIPQFELSLVADNLWYGEVNSDIDASQARRNIIFAEILDRLALNKMQTSDKQFEVVYNNETHRRIDTFMQALVDTGHNVQTRIVSRIANFASLKTRDEEGKLRNVVIALLVRTGILDSEGKEAILPAVHSELQINVTKNSDTMTPSLEANAVYYQGVSRSGFFPLDLAKVPKWLGYRVADVMKGEEALHSIKLAGLMTHLIVASANNDTLVADGYGITGVCNDSVAIVQQVIRGRVTPYPLLMLDDSVNSELQKSIDYNDPRDILDYLDLATSIIDVPNDMKINSSSVERALGSIPWDDGDEPFPLVVEAKEILRYRLSK